MAAQGLVPIAMAASPDKLDGAKKTYAKLLASAEAAYRESSAHYRALREEMTSLETPDARMDLAFEWGKVALDKGFVCNPHLGCGLIAGLGPVGHDRAARFRLVLRRRHLHQRVGHLVVRRPRHHQAVARVPAQAAAR